MSNVKKLLIVDDQPMLADAISMVAQSVGSTVATCSRSASAMELFSTFQPDIVVLDILMPGKDGVELLTEIEAAGSAARIIMTSGDAGAFRKLDGRPTPTNAANRVTTLLKPFSVDDLKAALLAA